MGTGWYLCLGFSVTNPCDPPPPRAVFAYPLFLFVRAVQRFFCFVWMYNLNIKCEQESVFSLKIVTIECFGWLKSLISFAQILNHRGDSTKQRAGHVSKHFFLREENIIGERVIKVRKEVWKFSALGKQEEFLTNTVKKQSMLVLQEK